MPKFNIEVSFSLATEISPDGVRFDYSSASVDEYSDDSYFSSTEVETSGGQVTFTVEAEDEDHARDAVEEIVYGGMEIEDDNGFTWAVIDFDMSIERVEMSKDEALGVVRNLLDRLAAEGRLTPVEREAFDVLLQDI